MQTLLENHLQKNTGSELVESSFSSYRQTLYLSEIFLNLHLTGILNIMEAGRVSGQFNSARKTTCLAQLMELCNRNITSCAETQPPIRVQIFSLDNIFNKAQGSYCNSVSSKNCCRRAVGSTLSLASVHRAQTVLKREMEHMVIDSLKL